MSVPCMFDDLVSKKDKVNWLKKNKNQQQESEVSSSFCARTFPATTTLLISTA